MFEMRYAILWYEMPELPEQVTTTERQADDALLVEEMTEVL